jgi:hypothetical protein
MLADRRHQAGHADNSRHRWERRQQVHRRRRAIAPFKDDALTMTDDDD